MVFFIFCVLCFVEDATGTIRDRQGESLVYIIERQVSGIEMGCFVFSRSELKSTVSVWFGSVRFGSVRFEGLKGTMLDAVVKESLEESRRGLTQ